MEEERYFWNMEFRYIPTQKIGLGRRVRRLNKWRR